MYIGVRVTKKEKEGIVNFVNNFNKNCNEDQNLSEFIRNAIFSHIYHIKHCQKLIK